MTAVRLRWFAIFTSGLLLFSCAGRRAYEQRLDAVRQQLATAQERGAYHCAAPELARAESHVDFAEAAYRRGDALRASEHLNVVESNLSVALQADPRRCVTSDRDQDGVSDPVDACPDVPEDLDGYEDEDGCPDLDNDGDGLKDVQDACPNEAGPKVNKGCPDLDGDNDGVPDRVDQCPKEPGPKERKGCPRRDRDGDGVVDAKDRCPDVPGKAPSGCPKKVLVQVTKSEIKITQKIQFQTGKAVIRGRISFMILDQVAAVLGSRPKMKVIIEGHTDSVGSAEYNLRLSNDRANSVRDSLIRRGIESERLRAVGYGESKPLESNATKDGRWANRRVQFRIVQPDTKTDGQ